MPKLLSWRADQAIEIEDRFIDLAEDDPAPASDVIVPLHPAAERRRGALAVSAGRRAIGARASRSRALGPFLPRLALVALEFPKFRTAGPTAPPPSCAGGCDSPAR